MRSKSILLLLIVVLIVGTLMVSPVDATIEYQLGWFPDSGGERWSDWASDGEIAGVRNYIWPNTWMMRAIPEPATILLLGLGAVMVRKR